MVAWLLLLSAAVLEPGWATAIKRSDGLTRLWPSVLGLAGALASVVFLTFAMKTLPAGTAYSVFVGIGAIGVAAAGAVAFNESVSPAKLGCLLLVLVGVTGLHLIEH